ncbi:MAG TPA: response regulator transcription factor [Candidatus Dormibacteraeota bacterium]|nr:response regulator transcription factor [Candidatus Dormibacteraeota bacterium]
MTARVLIIEDDPDVGALEEAVLRQADYETRWVLTGDAGLEAAAAFHPDVVVLDVGLPDRSGLEICGRLAETLDAFILMVSGHTREEDKLKGLGLGADDYITKPFSTNEFLARVGAFLRRRDRYRTNSTSATQLSGDAVLDRNRQLLIKDDVSAVLTALEFKLLWFLVESEGRLLTRAQILEHVWNDVSGVPTRVVDVHVAALRKKIAEVGASLQINSVRGIGYRLDVAVVAES